MLVQDDPELLDDGGEIPKSQGRGRRFDSPAVNSPLYLTTYLSRGQLPPVLWRWPIVFLS